MVFQDNFVLTYYIIPILVTLAILAFYLFITRRRTIFKKGEETMDEEKEEVVGEPIQARVYDNMIRTVYNDTIPASLVKKIEEQHGYLGRKWLRDGKWLYALNKVADGAYRPVIPPYAMKNPPSKVHRALMQQEVGIIFNVEQEKKFLQKYWPVLLFVGVVLFFMWTLVMK